MAGLLQSGELQRHVFQTLQPSYARRYRILISAVQLHLLPLGLVLPLDNRQVMGGYFIWILLPIHLTGERLASLAKQEQNLEIMPGSTCAVKGDELSVSLDRFVRLCFAWEEEDRLAEGVERLGQVIRRMQEYTPAPS